MKKGGYDDGYRACPCFWGDDPGSLITKLQDLTDQDFCAVLDLGCGEGKNAAHFAKLGAHVDAIDISAIAVANGMARWPDLPIRWQVGDAEVLCLDTAAYDLVVAYGFLHCLSSPLAVVDVCRRMISATRPSGYLVVCAFNDRRQELELAHPGFLPVLMQHDAIVSLFSELEIVFASDSDLTEVHPHNQIRHTHSMTRLIARKMP